MATATAFFASTSCCCISSSTWLNIFSGSSALVMRSLMLLLIRVPRREKSPTLKRVGDQPPGCNVIGRRGSPTASVTDRKLPRHVGIIMDGNGRWAQQRGLERIAGHREGA